MAAFCTKCHKEMGFSGEPDIKVQEVFESLKGEGTYLGVGVCEGCTLIAVANIKGELKVQYMESGWTDYDRPLKRAAGNELPEGYTEEDIKP